MDHLTWLMKLQESDEVFTLPEGRMIRRGAAYEADVPKPGQASPLAAVRALAAALQETETAVLQAEAAAGQMTAARGSGDGSSEVLRRPGSAPAAAAAVGGADTVYTEVLRERGSVDMEAISRFFERDARRYG